jgi:Uma2 family endonuclease
MVTQLKPIQYPESDGQPMADNTLQYRWIVTIQGGIDAMFKNNPDVFVAGDLLWYPVEGNNKIRIAPDILVAFERPKGDRGSYLQWKENNITPQVVFEILSPGNTLTEMAKKLQFYNQYGVEEYYLYDPDKNDLSGWIRRENSLKVIETINNWISPRLKIKFVTTEPELEIYRPDGRKFVSFVELETQRELAEAKANLATEKAQRLADKLKELGINPDDI